MPRRPPASKPSAPVSSRPLAVEVEADAAELRRVFGTGVMDLAHRTAQPGAIGAHSIAAAKARFADDLRQWWRRPDSAAVPLADRLVAIRTVADEAGTGQGGALGLHLLVESLPLEQARWRRWLAEPNGPGALLELLLLSCQDRVATTRPHWLDSSPRVQAALRLWSRLDVSSLAQAVTGAITTALPDWMAFQRHQQQQISTTTNPAVREAVHRRAMSHPGSSLLRLLRAMRPPLHPGLTRRGTPARAPRDKTPVGARVAHGAWIRAIIDVLAATLAKEWPNAWLNLLLEWPGPWPAGEALRLLNPPSEELSLSLRSHVLAHAPWTEAEVRTIFEWWPSAMTRNTLVSNPHTTQFPAVAEAVLSSPSGSSLRTLMLLHDRGNNRDVAGAVLVRLMTRDPKEARLRLTTHAHWASTSPATWPKAVLRALLNSKDRDLRLFAVRAMGRDGATLGSVVGVEEQGGAVGQSVGHSASMEELAPVVAAPLSAEPLEAPVGAQSDFSGNPFGGTAKDPAKDLSGETSKDPSGESAGETSKTPSVDAPSEASS